MSEREMISRSHPENEAIRRETVKWQQRENDALRDENEKLRLELDMQQATILVPSQKDDQRRIERLNSALKEALDEAARLRRAMHDIYEVYAGSEGDLKQAEGYYLLCLITEMSGIAAEHKRAAAAIRE